MRRHPERRQCRHAATGSGMVTEEAGNRAITPEGSSNPPRTGYAFLASQTCSGSIVHAFFLELAGLQLICKAQRGRSTNTGVLPVPGAR